ncbi:unnamed protein product [Leptidea sinapis]|uniref:Tuberin-type domain-containing protein n=1 Tax=Leptidea sinapis TaxID=189913 RepID=A0A5E4QEQ6_9NEOP|nr:unnamed protein product [Leptidea sinapis]
MSSYHAYLEPPTQQRIVRCLLKYGMVLRTPQQYIMALTAFALETRDTMVRMLPEVLLDLSKISDTKAIASPMLEFLSRAAAVQEQLSRAPLSGKVAGQGAPAAFHVELTETCVDLLARYTFTPCSVKPQRSERTDGLFNGGQSTTWLVGHKLVTITTSGCLQSAARRALCDRCSATCCQAASDDLSATAAAPHVQVRDSSESNGSSSNHLHPEVKRCSCHPADTSPGKTRRKTNHRIHSWIF